MTTKDTREWIDKASRLGDGVKKAGRDAWLVGLGAVAATEQEARGAIDRLRIRGEEFEKSDRNVLGKAVDRAGEAAKAVGSRIGETVETTTSTLLHATGVPSRGELRTLIERVETLTEKVEALVARG